MSKTITVSDSLERRLSDMIDASVARILADNHPIDYCDEMIADIQLSELLGYDTSDMVLDYENELLTDIEYSINYLSQLNGPLEDFEAGLLQRLMEHER